MTGPLWRCGPELQLREAEINLMLVMPEGQGVMAVGPLLPPAG